ncbi:MAG: hypothetical protein QOG80_633 [Pseudonocardiales bacterium]|jgi:hypothetical protein|nr:hypothetical protein [Pseudonocardiales bacterium]
MSGPSEPTREQVEERARRADKATRRALAAILALEGVVVLLVPRAIAFTDSGLGGMRAGLLIGLGVVLILGAAVQRRSWGIGFGSALQLLFVGTGVWLVAMFVVGAIFAAIWVYLLTLRHELVGTPGGARMLVS